MELDIRIFLEGILCEYVKYCRDDSEATLEDLYAYTKIWVQEFLTRRSAEHPDKASPLPTEPQR